jgi:hypothetical protein
MAFLRFNRDKRGYEHFYLVEATTNRRGKTRARVLYWFRTPPNVKVGRQPFDDEVRRTLEQQNPGVVFDWRKIVETPIPSADAERWRERRRLERAEKAARRAEAAAPRRAVEPEEIDEDVDAIEASDLVDSAVLAESGDLTEPGELAPVLEILDEALDDEAEGEEDIVMTSIEAASPVADPAGIAPAVTAESQSRRRRRRRRGRRPGDAPRPEGATSAAPAAETREPAEPPAPDPVDRGDPVGE